jgi:diadenosine tetraphosphate (Ap4A) HIT family hydrolase
MKARPCFICGLVSGDPDFAHHVVFEDDFAIAFLNRFPPLLGYVLVCPKAHLEQVTGDFSRHDYLRLQALIYDVGQALRACLEVERVYVLSLGSQAGNRHVHCMWRPCRPGFRSRTSSSPRWMPSAPAFWSWTRLRCRIWRPGSPPPSGFPYPSRGGARSRKGVATLPSLVAPPAKPQRRSNRSASMTLVQAAAKSFTNFACESEQA